MKLANRSDRYVHERKFDNTHQHTRRLSQPKVLSCIRIFPFANVVLITWIFHDFRSKFHIVLMQINSSRKYSLRSACLSCSVTKTRMQPPSTCFSFSIDDSFSLLAPSNQRWSASLSLSSRDSRGFWNFLRTMGQDEG